MREAFGGATNAEIARQLGRTEPAVKNYIDGRIPAADDLVAISYLTGCSVHWLLTGDGPREFKVLPMPEGEPLEPMPAISKEDREMVESLIAALRRSLGQE